VVESVPSNYIETTETNFFTAPYPDNVRVVECTFFTGYSSAFLLGVKGNWSVVLTSSQLGLITPQLTYITTQKFSANTWYHLFIDLGNNTFTLGTQALVAQSNITQANNSNLNQIPRPGNSSANYIVIGGSNNNNNNYQVNVGNLRLYDGILSASETDRSILDILSRNITTKLVGMWVFGTSQSTNNMFSDLSPNGNSTGYFNGPSVTVSQDSLCLAATSAVEIVALQCSVTLVLVIEFASTPSKSDLQKLDYAVSSFTGVPVNTIISYIDSITSNGTFVDVSLFNPEVIVGTSATTGAISYSSYDTVGKIANISLKLLGDSISNTTKILSLKIAVPAVASSCIWGFGYLLTLLIIYKVW